MDDFRRKIYILRRKGRVSGSLLGSSSRESRIVLTMPLHPKSSSHSQHGRHLGSVAVRKGFTWRVRRVWFKIPFFRNRVSKLAPKLWVAELPISYAARVAGRPQLPVEAFLLRP